MVSLNAVAQKLVEPGKGILAADESEPTIAKRFAKIGLPSTEELRRDYREMLFRAKQAMTSYISGAILNQDPRWSAFRNNGLFRVAMAGQERGQAIQRLRRVLTSLPQGQGSPQQALRFLRVVLR